MITGNKQFPPFNLKRLLDTVFNPQDGEKVCILIDLENPYEIKDFGFLKKADLTIQRYAHDIFYKGLQSGVMKELGLKGGDLFAYKITGGSNLDMDDEVVDISGNQLSFENDIYPNFDIILCISTYSATAPLTASAKKFKFRGATLHGLNQTILDTGLSVDYNEVSKDAEKLRLGMTRANYVKIDFEVNAHKCSLKLLLGGQEAQKSHGLCRGKKPDIANLPAGEIFFVPTGAEGKFPMKYEEDGSIALMEVQGGRIVDGTLISGQPSTLENHLKKIKSDPVTGELGELGFGTQRLPVSGRDIQDEKILGTFHIATGRSDHLGGGLTPDKFENKKNATHDDILFAPHKTPEVSAPRVRAYWDNREEVLIENYKPSKYMHTLLTS